MLKKNPSIKVAVWKKLLLVVCIWSGIFLNTANAQIQSYKGQALFIWNFTKHINWQSTSSTIFTIGVYGQSNITTELNNNLKGKLVNTKTVDVKVINSLAEAEECQIIYVPISKSKELQNLINSATSKGILVITEEDLVTKGAGISFLLVEDKLRFKINQEVLAKNGLQISTGLLGLAVKI